MGSNRVYVTESGSEVHGIMAEFADPASLYHACERVRDAGYSKWDSYSPFPIHGMEDAMGVKRTKLPLIVAACGFSGAGLGFLFQWWVATNGYALVTQGKPYNSWQAFIPVTFELGILFSAFASLIGMLALNGLPRWHHPLFAKERFLKSSDDKFFICVEAKDPKFDPERTRAILRDAGAAHIELVEEDAGDAAPATGH